MNRPVTVKSSKYGLIIHFREDIPFSELLNEVEQIFKDSGHFFGRTKLAISFEGRILTKDQEQQLIDLISDSTQIEIVCIVDNDEKREKMYKRMVEQSLEKLSEKDGLFCRGTLHRNQVLESEKSIVILGDVEHGATVVTKGSIIIIGTLRGTVYAGASGDCSAYVVSLSMKPRHLKIGNIPAGQNMKQQTETMSMTPQIAVVEGSEISVRPLDLESGYIQEEMKWAK